MLTFLTCPQAPPQGEATAYEADPSLSGILGYAHENRLQFGTELVYTYGPLGFLVFFLSSPQASWLRLAVDLGLCYTVATGLCLAAWRLRPIWRLTVLGAFAWAASNCETRTDLVLNTGILCWGLLSFVESGRRLALCSLIFIGLAVFSALAKNSFILVAGVSLLVLASDVWVRGRRRLAIGIVIAGGASFVWGWMISGQELSHVGPFLANALAMVQGYNAALGWEELQVLRRNAIVVPLLMMMLVLARTLTAFSPQEEMPKARDWRLGARRALLLAWVSCLGFTAWKHGFVRAYSGNVAMCFAFLSVLALALDVVPCGGPAVGRWARGLGVAAGLVPLAALQWLFFAPWHTSLSQPFRAIRANVCRLASPAEHQRRMREVVQANRREAQLPRLRQLIGKESVDVFGRRQAYAFFNDLNYRPRPVPQSYAACNSKLMRLNEEYYMSKAAPEYVLFEMTSLDNRLPPLEDARVLRHLLINYEPRAAEGHFLLLKRRGSEAARVTLLREGRCRPGEAIDLRGLGAADVWLEVQMEPSLSGWLRQVLYRPPTIRLAAWQEPGKGLMTRQRAPASMLAAGFLASPLLLRNADVTALYLGKGVARPGACSIELVPGEERYWRETYHYRISRIENRLGRCVPEELAWKLSDSGPARIFLGAAEPQPNFEAPFTTETWSSGAITQFRGPIYHGDATKHREKTGRENLAGNARFSPFALRRDTEKRPAEKTLPETRDSRPLRSTLHETWTGWSATRPFVVFRNTLWRPTRPPPGPLQEWLAFGAIAALPVLSAGALGLFIRAQRRGAGTGWGRLVLGNALVLACLVTLLFLPGEIYYRFCYDTTDSLAYTKVSERWVQRHWHVNGAGCRDNIEYGPVQEPGKRRVTFVGDSFTAGHGIKDVGERFPNRIREAHPEWEVHVLANVGLDTGNEALLLKKVFHQGYEADQVVLVYCLNDIGELVPQEGQTTEAIFAGLDHSGWLVRNSYLANLLYHRIKAARLPFVKDYCSFVRGAYRGRVWEQQQERLAAFRDLVEAHGGKLCVVTFPFLNALGPRYEYQFVHDELDQLWRKLGVPHLDLLAVYRDLPPSRLTVNAYDAHPNAYACQLAAGAIEPWLKTCLGEGLVKEAKERAPGY